MRVTSEPGLYEKRRKTFSAAFLRRPGIRESEGMLGCPQNDRFSIFCIKNYGC
jgi:hypothetical protein